MVIQDTDKCTKSPTGEHVWNYAPRPDNCRLGTCRYCEQQRVFEGALTHTAAILKPNTPVKPETMTKAVEIAEKSLMREEIPPLKSGAIAESYHAEVLRRIVAGEKPKKIASDIGYYVESVYTFKYSHKWEIAQVKKLSEGGEIKPRAKIVPRAKTAVVEKDKPIEPKKNGHKPFDTRRKGTIMVNMKRVAAGEIPPKNARNIILSYKEMLEYEEKQTTKELRDIKQSLSAINEAVEQLDVIQQGEKAVVDKVLAAVR